MFSVQPYAALRQVIEVTDTATLRMWKPCRVVGIDARGSLAQFVVEIRNADGTFYIDLVESIRKPEPANPTR
jgi:prenyltransferase beta subunit